MAAKIEIATKIQNDCQNLKWQQTIQHGSQNAKWAPVCRAILKTVLINKHVIVPDEYFT